MLEARIARREAELEALIPHTCTCHVPAPSRVPQDFSSGPLALTKERALNVLDQTAQRNRALEIELRGLARNVRNPFFFLLDVN